MQEFNAAQPLEELTVLSRHSGILAARARWQGHWVFVKTVEAADLEIRRRFEHEGAVAAMMHHPLVGRLSARTPTQLIFPWVDGGTLRQRVQMEPLSIGEAVSVTAGMLRAAAYMHSVGVTHQDLKPENVLLRHGVAAGHAVQVVDFGMSHARNLEFDVHSGTRMGTPHFMAPEQFQGVRGEARSDLYSLGVLLFDCLAGHPPYEDALGWLAGIHEPREALPGPPELHDVMRIALQRNPADRPASALDMLSDLQAAARALDLPLDSEPLPGA